MKQIPLSQGKFAIVDDEDYDFLMQWKWCATKMGKTFYAVRNIYPNGRQTSLLMHRLILNLTDTKILCDHRDMNGLNNQKSNIRPCTKSENQRNVKKRTHNRSGYKGVTWNEATKKWRAQIGVNGKVLYLGTFISIINAALSYDAAAKKYFGEFAKLNFE